MMHYKVLLTFKAILVVTVMCLATSSKAQDSCTVCNDELTRKLIICITSTAKNSILKKLPEASFEKTNYALFEVQKVAGKLDDSSKESVMKGSMVYEFAALLSQDDNSGKKIRKMTNIARNCFLTMNVNPDKSFLAELEKTCKMKEAEKRNPSNTQKPENQSQLDEMPQSVNNPPQNDNAPQQQGTIPNADDISFISNKETSKSDEFLLKEQQTSDYERESQQIENAGAYSFYKNQEINQGNPSVNQQPFIYNNPAQKQASSSIAGANSFNPIQGFLYNNQQPQGQNFFQKSFTNQKNADTFALNAPNPYATSFATASAKQQMTSQNNLYFPNAQKSQPLNTANTYQKQVNIQENSNAYPNNYPNNYQNKPLNNAQRQDTFIWKNEKTDQSYKPSPGIDNGQNLPQYSLSNTGTGTASAYNAPQNNNGNSLTTGKALKFAENLYITLCDKAPFKQVFHPLTTNGQVISIVPYILLKALLSCGYPEVKAQEIAKDSSSFMKSFPEGSSTQSYAEAICKMLMVQFNSKGLIGDYPENQAKYLGNAIVTVLNNMGNPKVYPSNQNTYNKPDVSPDIQKNLPQYPIQSTNNYPDYANDKKVNQQVEYNRYPNKQLIPGPDFPDKKMNYDKDGQFYDPNLEKNESNPPSSQKSPEQQQFLFDKNQQNSGNLNDKNSDIGQQNPTFFDASSSSDNEQNNDNSDVDNADVTGTYGGASSNNDNLDDYDDWDDGDDWVDGDYSDGDDDGWDDGDGDDDDVDDDQMVNPPYKSGDKQNASVSKPDVNDDNQNPTISQQKGSGDNQNPSTFQQNGSGDNQSPSTFQQNGSGDNQNPSTFQSDVLDDNQDPSAFQLDMSGDNQNPETKKDVKVTNDSATKNRIQILMKAALGCMKNGKFDYKTFSIVIAESIKDVQKTKGCDLKSAQQIVLVEAIFGLTQLLLKSDLKEKKNVDQQSQQIAKPMQLPSNLPEKNSRQNYNNVPQNTLNSKDETGQINTYPGTVVQDKPAYQPAVDLSASKEYSFPKQEIQKKNWENDYQTNQNIYPTEKQNTPISQVEPVNTNSVPEQTISSGPQKTTLDNNWNLGNQAGPKDGNLLSSQDNNANSQQFVPQTLNPGQINSSPENWNLKKETFPISQPVNSYAGVPNLNANEYPPGNRDNMAKGVNNPSVIQNGNQGSWGNSQENRANSQSSIQTRNQGNWPPLILNGQNNPNMQQNGNQGGWDYLRENSANIPNFMPPGNINNFAPLTLTGQNNPTLQQTGNRGGWGYSRENSANIPRLMPTGNVGNLAPVIQNVQNKPNSMQNGNQGNLPFSQQYGMNTQNSMQNGMNTQSFMQNRMNTQNPMQNGMNTQNSLQNGMNTQNFMQNRMNFQGVMQNGMNTQNIMQSGMNTQSIMQNEKQGIGSIIPGNQGLRSEIQTKIFQQNSSPQNNFPPQNNQQLLGLSFPFGQADAGLVP